MKKIFILVFTLFIILMHIDIKAATAKRIDLKIKENEINIVFIKLKESTSLLVSDETESKLFFIDYKSEKGIEKVLDIFNLKAKKYWINETEGDIDNIHVTRDRLKISGYNLCIVKNKKEVKNCDFVYLLDLKEEFKVDENTLAIFYDENIKDEHLSVINESWVDSHIVSLESFTILKINREEYNILVVPLANN